MATSYTSLLGLALPVTGELAGTWGTTVNNSITSLLDTAVAGTTTLSTDADVTLTTTTGASNQARQMILLCSGARTALRTITAPAQSKVYVVINNTTGGYGVKIVGSGPTTGVTVANGKTAVLAWNGSDFVEVAPATATTATNLAGGLAGSVPYQSGAGATTFLGIGTNNYVLTSDGSAPLWTANTGTGNVVRASSPSLTTPTLGVASATSINKLAITAPATSATLTIADGKTLTASNTLTFTGTDSSSVAFGTGGTVAYTSNNLSVFAATTSAQLAGVISDETGSGSLVFGTSPTLATPTITTSATVPLVIGGTGTTSTLTLRSTSGVGTTGADIILQTGNNGATEAMRIINSGNVGIGTNAPSYKLHVSGSTREPAMIESSSATDTIVHIKNTGAGGSDWQLRSTANSSPYGGGAFVIYDNAASDRLIITSAGNIGISRSPSYLLDVNGTARFNTTIGVGNTAPAASGAGVSFPATQAASSDANTLDDYEEGTWTPTQGAGLTVVGSYSSAGRYTKIGRTVTVCGYLGGSTSVAISSANTVLCGGLPFTAAASPVSTGVLTNNSFNTTVGIFNNTAATTISAAGTVSATVWIYFSMTYDV